MVIKYGNYTKLKFHKKMNKIIFIISIFCLFSCKSSKQSNSNISNNYSLEWDMQKIKPAKDIIDSIQYIPIETHPNGLFGDIQKIYFNDNKIVIFDQKKANGVFVFNDNGDFLFRVGNKGGGPGEYSILKNIDVNGKYIYLLANSQKKILIFDMDGNFIEEKKLPFHAHDLAVMDNGDILFTYHYPKNDPEKENAYRITRTDSNFKIKEELYKVNDNDAELSSPSYFSNFDDRIAYSAYVLDTIPVFSRDSKRIETYSIDFKKNKVPSRYKANPKEFLNQGNYFFLFETHKIITDKYLIGGVFLDHKVEPFILDLSTNEIYLNDRKQKEGQFFKYFHYPYGKYGNKIVTLINGFFYEKLISEGFPKIDSLHEEHLNTPDNYALVLYTLK